MESAWRSLCNGISFIQFQELWNFDLLGFILDHQQFTSSARRVTHAPFPPKGCLTSQSWFIHNNESERLLGSLWAPEITLPTHIGLFRKWPRLWPWICLLCGSNFGDIPNPFFTFSRSTLLWGFELLPRVSLDSSTPLWFRICKFLGLTPPTFNSLIPELLNPLPRSPQWSTVTIESWLRTSWFHFRQVFELTKPLKYRNTSRSSSLLFYQIW